VLCQVAARLARRLRAETIDSSETAHRAGV
jgi:hypothetical protein